MRSWGAPRLRAATGARSGSGAPHPKPWQSGSLRMSTMTRAREAGSETTSVSSCVHHVSHWLGLVCAVLKQGQDEPHKGG